MITATGTLGARLEGIGNQQQLSGGGNGGGSGGGRGGGGGGGQAATVDLPSGPGGSGRQEVGGYTARACLTRGSMAPAGPSPRLPYAL